jgi:hypothetical protein
MAKTNFAPWSAETAQGIKTDPVDSNIKVKQEVIPAITVGTVNALTGEWTGVIESDTSFLIDATHEAIANGASVLSPQAQPDYIDMTGYTDLQIALKVSNAGNYAIVAVMGPDTNYFANLTPVAAGTILRGAGFDGRNVTVFESLVNDTVESISSTDTWNIFMIGNMLQDQKNLQFQITNNSGGPSNIQFAYLRVV